MALTPDVHADADAAINDYQERLFNKLDTLGVKPADLEDMFEVDLAEAYEKWINEGS